MYYEIKRLVHDLTFDSGTDESELEEHINDGWEIIDISTVSNGSSEQDGVWRQYITQVIVLKRLLDADEYVLSGRE
jgi:hypothetical protein